MVGEQRQQNHEERTVVVEYATGLPPRWITDKGGVDRGMITPNKKPPTAN